MKSKQFNNKYIFSIFISLLFLSQSVCASSKYTSATLDKKGRSKSGKVLIPAQPERIKESDTLSFNPVLEQGIPVLYGKKNKDEITGALFNIKGEKVENIPGTNRFNSLTGLVPGLYVDQNNGFPGKDGATLFIRGQHTFGSSNKSPLVLLDGVETDITQISPYDIESITVLKDAVSTAMYGLRATNGIVLITSKRGKIGKIKFNLNSQTSIVRPNNLPKFLGAEDYATLYNEASRNEGLLIDKYTQSDIDAYKNGVNPIKYPNHNWIGEFVKDYSIQSRSNLDISGGNENARYLFSVGYVHNNGVFVTDKNVNKYNTNSSLDLSDIHTNIDFKVSERLSVNVDLKAKFDRRNSPDSYNSTYESTLFQSMMDTPPMAYPNLNIDGSLAGNDDYGDNIYGRLNKSGYSIWSRTYLFGNFDADYKLDFILEGLKLKGKFGFSNYVDHATDRSKNFAVYQALTDTTYNKIGSDTQMSSSNQWSNNNRYNNSEVGLEYAKSFGNSKVKALFMADRQQYTRRDEKLPHIYQGVKGSFSYSNSSKYFVDFVFSYQGTEQFSKDDRYGFFPAIGLGWVLSNEKFMENFKTISYLKFRGSFGQTGNDFDPYAAGSPYFARIENYQSGGAYSFGVNPTSDGGFIESSVVNNLITWEKALKYNVGADAAFFKNRLALTIDYFYEKNKEILVFGTNPALFGTDFWYPEGILQNQGIEGNISWNHKVGDFSYFISTNATFVRNKIINQKEEQRAYDWMVRTNNPIETKFGYVFDRFFTENDNFTELPDQSLLGQVHPGDLKYKDLNGDNLIDENDQMKIGKSEVPELFYGVNAGINFKGIDLSILFQGASGMDKVFTGSLAYEFVGGKGNVTKEHLGRWKPGSGQNATYPRLGVQQTSNSRKTSTFWIKDGSYLRLKTIELGYTLPNSIIEKVHLTKLRIYANAYNLFTWSKIKSVDPETSSDGSNYPIPSIVSVGLNIGF